MNTRSPYTFFLGVLNILFDPADRHMELLKHKTDTTEILRSKISSRILWSHPGLCFLVSLMSCRYQTVLPVSLRPSGPFTSPGLEVRWQRTIKRQSFQMAIRLWRKGAPNCCVFEKSSILLVIVALYREGQKNTKDIECSFLCCSLIKRLTSAWLWCSCVSLKIKGQSEAANVYLRSKRVAILEALI